MKIGNPTDLWAGVMFSSVGAMFAIVAYGVKLGDQVLLAGYAMGTPARMGPGFFPFWLGVILVVIGLIISGRGILAKHGKPVDKFHWPPLAWVLGAVILFGLLMKTIGMLLAGIMLVVVASMGSHEFRLKPVLILAVCLTLFSAAVFVFGLKLPIPLCPAIESLQTMTVCRG